MRYALHMVGSNEDAEEAVQTQRLIRGFFAFSPIAAAR